MCACVHIYTICKLAMKALQRILKGLCHLAHTVVHLFRCYQDNVVRFYGFLITVIEGKPPTFFVV